MSLVRCYTISLKTLVFIFILLGCYEKAVTYSYPDGDTTVPIPMSQIESLIQLSEFCDQEFQYDCTLAPLTNGDVDFAFWEDRTGGKNNYFTGVYFCTCAVKLLLKKPSNILLSRQQLREPRV